MTAHTPARVCLLEHRRDPDRARPAAFGWQVCWGCGRDLARILTLMPATYTALATRLAPGQASTAPVSGGGHNPAAINTGAAAVRYDLAETLAYWAGHHARILSLTPPRDVVQLHTRTRAWWTGRTTHDAELYTETTLTRTTTPAGDPAVTAPWLARQLDRACAEDWIDTYANELRDVRHRALGVLYPSGTRRFTAGPCPAAGCDGDLTAVLRDTDSLLPSELVCDACGTAYPARRLLDPRFGAAVRTAIDRRSAPALEAS